MNGMVQDSIKFILTQQQLYLDAYSGAIDKFIYPVIGALVSGFILQTVMSRKNIRDIVSGLNAELSTKVDINKFDDSIRRMHEKREFGEEKLHDRINQHIERDNKMSEGIMKDLTKAKEDISFVRGILERSNGS